MTTPALGAPRSIGRVDALDGIRGLAIVAVLGWHASEHTFRGGHLGVAVFFTLSGFLITTLLLDEHAARGRLDFAQFYRRRAARLVPALAVALGLTIVVAAVHDGVATMRDTLWGTLSTLTYTSNFFIAFWHPRTVTDVWSWSWSLALEEQFYVVWPVLFLLLLRRKGVRGLLVATGTTYVVASTWRLVVAGGVAGDYNDRLYYAPDTRLDAIVLGCLLAVWLHGARRRSTRHSDGRAEADAARRAKTAAARRAETAAAVAVVALVLLLSVLAVCGPIPGLLVPGMQLAPLLSAVLIYGVVTAPKGLVAALFRLRPLMWLGRRSYGIYVYNVLLMYSMPHVVIAHWRPIGALTWIACSFVVAELSYRFVEQPLLRRVRSTTARRDVPAPRDATSPVAVLNAAV